MPSTGHSSIHALSSRSTHGSAMMCVTGCPLRMTSPHDRATTSRGRVQPNIPGYARGTRACSDWIAVVLDPCDVGHRVVLRHRITPTGPRTDLLGELVTAGPEAVV